MIQYDEQTLQLIEEEITYIYNSDVTGYPESEFLLDLRKSILNEQALKREAQEELLPDIIAFNDALQTRLNICLTARMNSIFKFLLFNQIYS